GQSHSAASCRTTGTGRDREDREGVFTGKAKPCRLLSVAGQQREGAHIVRTIENGETRRIFSGKAAIAELRLLVAAAGFADRAVETLDRQEAKRINTDEVGHLLDRHTRGEQLCLLGRID